MAIDVKIVDQNGVITIKTIQTDDPHDPEIRATLGTNEKSSLFERTIFDWEVIKSSDADSSILVIGKAPILGDDPARRKSCDLSDDQVKELVSSIDWKTPPLQGLLG